MELLWRESTMYVAGGGGKERKGGNIEGEL